MTRKSVFAMDHNELQCHFLFSEQLVCTKILQLLVCTYASLFRETVKNFAVYVSEIWLIPDE
jgi:hypothetical protein